MVDVGSTVAGYRVEAVLGRGGMGVVYEATQLQLGRTVALKLLTPHLSGDPAFRRRFEREGHVQAQLDHPHIITVYEAGESEEGLFLAMRLVRGPTLKDLILARQLDAGRTLRLLKPIADAVDAAHAQGLIHRDIKPQNILVGGRDHPWLADFGLTKSSEQTAITKSGQFVGTLDYISPEQITDFEATTRSDIYSLGGVLYEALVGSVPFPKKSEAAVIYAHLSLPPPEVTAERPELPVALDHVIARAMAKDPAARYESAGAMLQAATEAFDRRSRAVLQVPPPVEAPEQLGVRQPERRASTERPRQPPASTVALPRGETRPSRRRGLVAAAVAAGAVGLGVAAFVVAGAGKTETRASDGATPASAGALSIRVPSAWRPLSSTVAVPGLNFRDSLAIGPAGSPAHGLIVGSVAATGRLLVPDAFKNAVPTELSPQPVQLGAVQAYRYGPVTPRGFGRSLVLYAAPTDHGVATAACFTRTVDPQYLEECERVASTIRITKGRAYSIRPAPTFAQGLDRSLAPLLTTRQQANAELHRAKRPADQARAAGRISAAYTRAAEAVKRLDGGPLVAVAQASLADALKSASSAYNELARAARGVQPRVYARAAGAVVRAEGLVRRRLGELKSLGYRPS